MKGTKGCKEGRKEGMFRSKNPKCLVAAMARKQGRKEGRKKGKGRKEGI
jgi:hypothetical protein